MKNWNLRTLVFMRSLCMMILPLWFLIHRSRLSSAFFWLLVYSVALVVKEKLEKEIKAQMDECALALLDRLARHMENMTYMLAVILIIFLTALPKAENPGAMGLVAAQVLAWGLFGIHLYRGIAFWIRDRMGLVC